MRPTPTITLSSSDGKPLSDRTSVNVQMDGHKMIVENGEVDISAAVSVMLAIYHIYNVAYPSQLKRTFSFLEAFILKLETPTLIAVQRVANAMQM